jgi:hypothetical protein
MCKIGIILSGSEKKEINIYIYVYVVNLFSNW